MSHLNAKFYFERDLKCIENFFIKKSEKLDLMQINFEKVFILFKYMKRENFTTSLDYSKYQSINFS